jgi:hypothetical protein
MPVPSRCRGKRSASSWLAIWLGLSEFWERFTRRPPASPSGLRRLAVALGPQRCSHHGFRGMTFGARGQSPAAAKYADAPRAQSKCFHMHLLGTCGKCGFDAHSFLIRLVAMEHQHESVIRLGAHFAVVDFPVSDANADRLKAEVFAFVDEAKALGTGAHHHCREAHRQRRRARRLAAGRVHRRGVDLNG